MRKRTIRDIDLAGKRVLLRVDYNVQVDEGGIVDDLRLRESVPTIQALQRAGARVIICSHRGRPRGRANESLRNWPLALSLSELLSSPVVSTRDCVGPNVQSQADALGPGEILLLENVRFHAGEEASDAGFARELARLADIFVNDAFGTAHRAHASIVGVPQHLPAVAGLLLEREADMLEQVARAPEHPLGLVLGGAKMSDKLPIVRHLCKSANVVCIGGAMANTMLKARGIDVGDSLVENDQLDTARAIFATVAERADLDLLLPEDAVVCHGDPRQGTVRVVPVTAVPSGWRVLDIGPRTVDAFARALSQVRTALWNGPMGLFEQDRFADGSRGMALTLSRLEAVTVVGGGETAAVVQRAGVADRITHLSTGGAATLAMLAGESLPGVEALLDRSGSDSNPE